ncbi:UDP-glucose/GDP-mannose dehydrogenase family protein [soil metagenome]
MRVLVQGLWHLGSVTAACLARAGHHVIGLDRDAATIATLQAGKAPISEPGLDDLLRAHPIELTSDVTAASRADVAWVTYDTPVDADDRADVEFVITEVAAMLPHLRDGAVVLVSSQLPVGSVARLEKLRPNVHFACSPENLRLGKAIAVFSDPDRVILGVRDDHTKHVLTELFAPITAKLEWMSVESAEMTKHAINAFLALSVTFANELASVCERVGADAKEVERGLKTESRIGPKAYLGPGGAFAGGTLARDIAFLTAMGAERGLALPLISGVRPSNEAHKKWARRRLEDRLGSLAGKTVAVLGLTYKAGTDTLRRSASVELCRDLVDGGAKVRAFDPAVKILPAELAYMELAPSAAAAIEGADALVIATEWPEFASLDLAALTATMKRKLVVDANRFLAKAFAPLDAEYYAVGVPDRG